MATALKTLLFCTNHLFRFLNPTAHPSVPPGAALVSARTALHQSVPHLLVVPNVRRGTHQDLPGTAALQKLLNNPTKISNLFPTSPKFYSKILILAARPKSLLPVPWGVESLLSLCLRVLRLTQALQDFNFLKLPVLVLVKQ
jgi:hypothetical protein